MLTIGLVGLLVAALFWSLELALRRVQAKRRGLRGPLPQALRDRFVAWRNNPKFRRIDVRHDANGFRRSSDVSLQKPRGTTRIFLLGGSAIYGSAGSFPHIDNRFAFIYNDELIDAELERLLCAAFPSRRWEVINAAVSGYCLHQQLAMLQSRILRYQPDHVILIDGYNDFISLYNHFRENPAAAFDVYEDTPGGEVFDRLANPQSLRSVLTFVDAGLTAHSLVYRTLSSQIPGMVRNPWRRRVTAERRVADPVHVADLTGEERIAAAAALDHAARYAHTARQIHHLLALDGIPASFVLQPVLVLSEKRFTPSEQSMYEYERSLCGPLYLYLFREMYAEFVRAMLEAAILDGSDFLTLTGVFDSSAEQCFTDFAHLTPAGNCVIAGRLFAHLRDRFAATPE